MKYFFVTLTLISTLSFSAIAGGPWTPVKGAGTFIPSVSPNIYSTISGRNQRIDLNRRVSDVSFQFYTEYGITDNFALVANVPFKYVRTSKKILQSDFFPDTLVNGGLFSLGNIEFELKYKVVDVDGFTMAVGFQTMLPVNSTNAAAGLRTGYNTWGFMPRLHIGTGFSDRFYGQYMGGFNWRNNNYSDEWYASVEFGGKSKDHKFFYAILVQAKQSLNNGSRNDANIFLTNSLHTGLYMNDEEYWAWSFKFANQLSDKLLINYSIGGGIVTRYIARTPAFTVGVIYNWDGKEPKLDTEMNY